MSTTFTHSEEEVISILVARDAMSREDAIELLKEAQQMVQDGEDPEEVLRCELGLEPDYAFGLFSLF